MKEKVEETPESDKEVRVERPKIGIQEIWRTIVKILSFGLLKSPPGGRAVPPEGTTEGIKPLGNVIEQTAIHAAKNELALIYFKHKLKRIREKE